MTYHNAAVEPPLVRFTLGLFALAALATLLAADWVRSFVPPSRTDRVRDVDWLRAPAASPAVATLEATLER